MVGRRILGILLVGTSIIMACSTNDRDSNNKYTVLYNEDDVDSLYISDVYDSVKYIQIDTGILLGQVTNIRYCDGFYYLKDSKQQNIVVLDSTGRLKNKIDKRGRTNSEYVNLTLFDVNPGNGNVVIYDQEGQSVLTYSREGKFLSSFSMTTDMLRDMAVFPDGSILCLNYEYEGPTARRGVWRISDKGEFIEQMVSVPWWKKFSFRAPGEIFCRLSPDCVGAMGAPDDNTIYHFYSTGEVEISESLNLGKHIPKRVLAQENPRQIPSDIRLCFWYSESKRWIRVILTDEFKAGLYFVDRQDKSHSIKRQEIVDDIFFPGIISCSSGMDYSIIYCDDLADTAKEKFPALKNYYKHILTIATASN